MELWEEICLPEESGEQLPNTESLTAFEKDFYLTTNILDELSGYYNSLRGNESFSRVEMIVERNRHNSFSHTDLAEELESNQETVTRILGELQDEDILNENGGLDKPGQIIFAGFDKYLNSLEQELSIEESIAEIDMLLEKLGKHREGNDKASKLKSFLLFSEENANRPIEVDEKLNRTRTRWYFKGWKEAGFAAKKNQKQYEITEKGSKVLNLINFHFRSFSSDIASDLILEAQVSELIPEIEDIDINDLQKQLPSIIENIKKLNAIDYWRRKGLLEDLISFKEKEDEYPLRTDFRIQEEFKEPEVYEEEFGGWETSLKIVFPEYSRSIHLRNKSNYQFDTEDIDRWLKKAYRNTEGILEIRDYKEFSKKRTDCPSLDTVYNSYENFSTALRENSLPTKEDQKEIVREILSMNEDVITKDTYKEKGSYDPQTVMEVLKIESFEELAI